MVLGVVVSIGAIVLTGFRDARLTDLSTVTTNNESITPSATTTLANTWGSGVGNVYNATTGLIASGNYSTSIDPTFGTITISNATQDCSSICDGTWQVTYNWYNTSRADWSLPNNASVGLGEYGNWFKIIVIVGIAAVVLSLIFLSFGRKGSAGQSY